ncbi:DNA mismatch repair protein-like protein msh-2 [Hesseltinella vesiculosa]|uniref:DNA mismatch repair protein MSH2 n=1 Tax=Hesseltinella vesiculosa TaxID=101127 RepID=A0A1X2GZ54_9FUNG|nr:DNA mismatch repair protein-like protein msh-2 [Hesseltinella vesiculosa]
MSTSLKDLPDIDKPEQQTFVRFFRSLAPLTDGTVRLFERESNQKRYYSFHGDDALLAADQIYHTTTVIKYWGATESAGGLPTTFVSGSVAENYLRDGLLNRQLRIEIWRTKKGTSNWSLGCKASPGNLQDVEDVLFTSSTMNVAPMVLAVKWSVTGDQKTVGVAFADASVKEIGVAEFMDNELYSNLEALVIQLGIKECLLPMDDTGKDYEGIKIRGIMDRCGIAITNRKRTDYQMKNVEQDLNRLLEGDLTASALPEFDLKQAMESCACLLKYLGLIEDTDNYKQFRMIRHNLDQYMRLDSSALQALNLMPSARDGSNKSMSLYGLLNHCKTSQGGRLLAQWLKQPLLNVTDIEKRQDLVSIMINDTELRQGLQESHLKNIPDLHRLAKKFQRGIANLQDVVRIYQVVIRLPAMTTLLNANEPEAEDLAQLLKDEFTGKIEELYEKAQKLEELVESIIDLEAVEQHEFVIRPDFDASLKELRVQMDDARESMDKEHYRVGQKLKMDVEKKLKLEKSSVYGYCFRLSRNDASALRGKTDIIEYTTQKAGVLFTSSTLKNLNESWSKLCDEYEKTQTKLVKEVIQIVASYCPVLESLGSVLARLDVLVSFAHVSIMAPVPFVRPTLTPLGQGGVELTEARHPCIEAQADVIFIPNDVTMLRDESEFLVITGPNMGGKSTYIRQIGVIALMAQVGCYVPCTEAKLCVFDSILARVGAGDSQLKGVSTFMAEMLETATILKSATQNSLIIIDELGRGTSTYDGFGLAWSISEFIASKIRALCLFATHFHELTDLGSSLPHVKNLNVAVHVDDSNGNQPSITLLYKVQEGVCDQSFGIHVAEMANFPPTVVQLAKRKAQELEQDPVSDDAMETDAQDSIQSIKNMIQEITQGGVTSGPELAKRIKLVKEKYKETIQANEFLKN